MALTSSPNTQAAADADPSIGRIVSVTGAKAIVLLDNDARRPIRDPTSRPDMGTLLAIETPETIVLAIVSALSVPVPAQREGEGEIWIAELGLVGELRRSADGMSGYFNRGVTIYPGLGDRVRVASKIELQQAFCGDMSRSVRVGCIRQDNTIPAMVGQFISLFKDTTLVIIVGMIDILGASQSANAQGEFLAQGLHLVTLPFVALAFWTGSYVMSREARRLEHRLGVGVR